MEKNFGSLFDALYSKFVLRDLFAKIIPGVVVMLSYYLLIRQQTSGFFPSGDGAFPQWVVLFGIAWTMGFVVQWLGNTSKITRELPTQIFGEKTTLKMAYDLRIIFQSCASENEKSIVERTGLIKEATGNLLISLVAMAVCGLVWMFSSPGGELLFQDILSRPRLPLFLVLSTGVLFCVLRWYNVQRAEREFNYMGRVVTARGRRKNWELLQQQ